MSDTDDTDVLLMIPPDFFLVHSDSDDGYDEKSHIFCEPHCGAVSDLITHVNILENRLNRIEVNSDICCYNSLNSSCNSVAPLWDMSGQQNDFCYLPNEAVSSTKSTPQKPRIKLRGNSLPSTPKTERRSRKQLSQRTETNADKEENRKLLGEIDQFLSNVKTIQLHTLQNSKSADTPIRFDQPTITMKDLTSADEADKKLSRLNLNDVDRLLKEMETQQQRMATKDKELELLFENKSTWKCGERKESVPDFGFGIRDLVYGEQTSSEPLVSKTPASKSENLPLSDSMSSSESTPQTILENPKRTNEAEKNLGNYSSIQKFSRQLSNDTVFESGITNPLFNDPSAGMSGINLFSLADVWNRRTSDVIISEREMKKLLPKLEEEKCRRKHCEKLIQELQMKILEMQQRLAVAVQVDSAKDEAILRFHEAWEKVAQRWQNLETERNLLSKQLYSVEEKTSAELAEAANKVAQYEQEKSKALDLAHSSQEKCNSLETERSHFLLELSDLRTQLKLTEENLQQMTHHRELLNEKLTNSEKASLKEKTTLLEAQNEIAQIKKVFLNCQNELTEMKSAHLKLQEKIKKEQSTISRLESQNSSLIISVENSKQSETALHKELKNLQSESERTKIELRNFYQQQVESLVKDKLKEFQDQLEQAEKTLQDELQSREQSIARSAAKQLQKLTEKHRLEIKLIEEKHKEEVRLYELQFTQLKQQIHLLQTKLESYQARRTDIAKELHNVMEAQWLEALRIINNGKSPLVESPHLQEEQKGSGDGNFDVKKSEDLSAAQKVVDQKPIKISTTGIHDYPFPYFAHSLPITTNYSNLYPSGLFETPVSSKLSQTSQQGENELQKYVKMLLDKLPKPQTEKLPEQSKQISLETQDSSTSNLMEWHQQLTAPNTTKGSDKFTAINKDRSGKPPWK